MPSRKDFDWKVQCTGPFALMLSIRVTNSKLLYLLMGKMLCLSRILRKLVRLV